MSKITVDIQSIKDKLVSNVQYNKPVVIIHKNTGNKLVMIKLFDDSFIFFDEHGSISYSFSSDINFLNENYEVTDNKATVIIEV